MNLNQLLWFYLSGDRCLLLTRSCTKEMLRVFFFFFSSSPCVNERATVQVPTGSHSQTDMTGQSNYWVADTPVWLGFISCRKRDSQITVYPHRAPSSGLIPQLQTEKPHTLKNTLTPSHERAHTPFTSENSCQPQLRVASSFYFHSHVSCACSQCVPTCLDPAPVSCQTHLSSQPSKEEEWQRYAGVCEGEQRRSRWHERDV